MCSQIISRGSAGVLLGFWFIQTAWHMGHSSGYQENIYLLNWEKSHRHLRLTFQDSIVLITHFNTCRSFPLSRCTASPPPPMTAHSTLSSSVEFSTKRTDQGVWRLEAAEHSIKLISLKDNMLNLLSNLKRIEPKLLVNWPCHVKQRSVDFSLRPQETHRCPCACSSQMS